MAYIKYSNGNILTWDDTINIGELITTANDGYWILTRIEYPEHSMYREDFENSSFYKTFVESDTELKIPPRFHSIKVLKGDGSESKRLTNECFAYHCKRITQDDLVRMREEDIRVANAKFDSLRQYC